MQSTAATLDFDLSAISFWEDQGPGPRDEAYAQLRAEHPVSWWGPTENRDLPPEMSTGGYWAVMRYADIRHVSRNPDVFCSGRGVMFFDAPPEMLEATLSFIAMDAPRHTTLRGLVSAAFTPRQVARIEDRIAVEARAVVDELLDHRDGDFVELVAKQLPMRTIAHMLGTAEADREQVQILADRMVSLGDEEMLQGRNAMLVAGETIWELTQIAVGLAEDRRAHPRDDLMTALVEAEVDGERLTNEEIAAFFALLSVAGNDTTRHTTSHTMRALCDFPDARASLVEDPAGRLPVAVEEFVRWASAVTTFRRTATRDTEIAGQPIAEGEKVVMFYRSGNFDETAFEDPQRFDVARDPNHHVGFGGGGPHYCLGASFARTQLRTIFTELLTRAPSLEVGKPVPMVSSVINGVKRMPFSR
jgi:cytochrome P450